MKLTGPSTNPPPTAEREPIGGDIEINVHPDARERLRELLMRPEMRAVGYSEFINRAVDAAEAELAPPCQAVIYHGPGHQSKSPCILTDAHELHRSQRGHRWNGDEGMTGFFDESPEED